MRSDDYLTGFKESRDVLMYYHTSIRNIGLYTSISLAGLAASRAYLKASTGFDKSIFLLFLGFFLIFNFISIQISRVVIDDIKEFEDDKLNIHCYYKQIPSVAFYVNTIAFTFGLSIFFINLFSLMLKMTYAN